MNNQYKLAPVALFAYKRPVELRHTLAALQANHLASETELYVFVDGPKHEHDVPKVNAVREIIESITGFSAIHRYYSDQNRGLATSIISGVSQLMKQHGSVIVLEDDLLTSHNFLDYMNQCLQEYKNQAKVFSVSAYSFPFQKPESYIYDCYFIQRPNSWGWATWVDRWQQADWAVSDYKEFENSHEEKRKFRQGGADLTKMLYKQQNDIIDSWYIRWCYSQFKASGLTVYPVSSKIQNIGFTEDATNTNVFNRYKTRLDEGFKRTFSLPTEIATNLHYHRLNLNEYSLGTRLYNRIKTYSIRLRNVLSTSKTTKVP